MTERRTELHQLVLQVLVIMISMTIVRQLAQVYSNIMTFITNAGGALQTETSNIRVRTLLS
jgi:hypothetical protein